MAGEDRLLLEHSYEGGDIWHKRRSGFQIGTAVKGTKDWEDHYGTKRKARYKDPRNT